MKYKAGDKVLIKSLDWYNENKDEDGNVHCGDKVLDNYMSVFCGSVVTIGGVYPYTAYDIREDMHCRAWTDEMIEGLVEEEVDLIPKFGEYSDNEPLDIPTMTTEFVKEHGLPCPDGYIFKDENGNVINATKIVLEKKKREYPKTYEECCKVLGVNPNNYLSIRNPCCNDGDEDCTNYELGLLGIFDSLWVLRFCRDAYWKIAGEEKVLGKPWEPDFTNDDEERYGIYTAANKVVKDFCGVGDVNTILTFPTEEMRDAFYENFKELIEQCKELL